MATIDCVRVLCQTMAQFIISLLGYRLRQFFYYFFNKTHFLPYLPFSISHLVVSTLYYTFFLHFPESVVKIRDTCSNI